MVRVRFSCSWRNSHTHTQLLLTCCTSVSPFDVFSVYTNELKILCGETEKKADMRKYPENHNRIKIFGLGSGGRLELNKTLDLLVVWQIFAAELKLPQTNQKHKMSDTHSSSENCISLDCSPTLLLDLYLNLNRLLMPQGKTAVCVNAAKEESGYTQKP